MLVESRRRHFANLNGFEKCQKGTLKLDLYKQPFRLLLPDEKDEYRTFAGALLTVITVIIVLVYAGFKLQTLLDYKDYKVQQKVFDDYYNVEIPLTPDDGLMIAAAVTRFEQVPPDIGALNFYRKQYSPNTDLNITRLESRPCTRDDFNVNGDNPDSKYFHATYKTAGELE